MLPILPFLIGGAIGTVAGVVLKDVYDEKDDINQTFDDKISTVDEWLDKKFVALDKYKDTLYEDEENHFSNSVEEEIIFQSLIEMKKRVYHDSFISFVDFYKKLENVDLGDLEYEEIDFSTVVLDEQIYDRNIQNNIKITTDLLFKANNLLNDIVLNLGEAIKETVDYQNFSVKTKEVIKEAFSLAKFIQKVCINENLSEDVVVKFSNIISNIEEEIRI
ncbi:hypothetical protein ACOL22_02580 [Aliarcobacter butzleri]|uniref:hypothetical protein n=1 Tax=Aliarcobacter butzleri TaxID=28197 RepID=UPI001EDC88FA|nr:hypothetical protein [Aliarcobacter butzleri]MCG3686853.1 hypothetical protein [Aliarcobacter butzleri]